MRTVEVRYLDEEWKVMSGHQIIQWSIEGRIGFRRDFYYLTDMLMAVISFQIADDHAQRFSRLAAGQGGKSALLRRLVGGLLSQSANTILVEPRRSRAERRVELTFTDEELEAIDGAAAARGLRRTVWLAALVRRRIFMRPAPVPTDAKTLEAIRSELRRIGVRVQQMAAFAEVARQCGEHIGVEASRMIAMSGEIRQLADQVGAARRGDLAYWATPE